ncbi:MAG: aspartate carbamoyltransferase [Candidatus Methanomethylophilaceae archaeon]|nr:aspartate carbamoyltransferase [Candidatus Methanomethylophilaceae archaeon]
MDYKQFAGRNIVSIKDLNREEIECLLALAEKMIPYAKGEKRTRALDGKIIANLFFEPSTRTRLSFETAAHRLGAQILDVSQMSATSIAKGETLADTIKMVDAYCDAMVIRHPWEGSARLATKYSTGPVVNAGDGAASHPTQTLLDLFTIQRCKGKIDGLNIALVGDLKYGRTVHSLADALTMFGAKLTFVAPDSLQMPSDIVDSLRRKGCEPYQTSNLEEVIGSADVLYVTRIQRERFPDPSEYQKVAGTYRIDNKILREAKSDLIVMHPLPRIDEIASEVDETQHAKYFEQAFNGIPVRMALLCAILGGEM